MSEPALPNVREVTRAFRASDPIGRSRREASLQLERLVERTVQWWRSGVLLAACRVWPHVIYCRRWVGVGGSVCSGHVAVSLAMRLAL
jgi:hypothetical protein